MLADRRPLRAAPSGAMLLARHVTLAVRGAARPFLATARGAQTRVAAVVPRCNHGGAGGIAVSLGPSRNAPTALSVGRFARRATVSYAAGCVSPRRRRHGWTSRRAVGTRARPLVRHAIPPRLLRGGPIAVTLKPPGSNRRLTVPTPRPPDSTRAGPTLPPRRSSRPRPTPSPPRVPR